MAYQLYTEVHFIPSGDAKQDTKSVKCYPDNKVAYLDKKTKVIELPKGIQYPHAESIANELMNKNFFTSFAIVKTIDPR